MPNFRNEVTPHVALVNSQDAPSVKHLVENAVWQLIHGDQVMVRGNHSLTYYFIYKAE